MESYRKELKDMKEVTTDKLCECCNGEHCCDCGKSLNLNERTPETDPYSCDIHSDHTLHLFCEECLTKSAMEI